MRLLVTMPVKNEAHRWLDASLSWASTFADRLFVYDDQSDDNTVDVALRHATVATRIDGPSFLDHEGMFRQRAWSAFTDIIQPELGDWVLALDADEFLVGQENLEGQIFEACRAANRSGHVAILLQVPEMFQAEFGRGRVSKLWRRTDGFWGTIAGTRLFKYLPDGVFRNKAMGCGAEPTYVEAGTHMRLTDAWLLHLGYVRDEDKTMKHERYTSLLDHGHNNDHVQSIVREPVLEVWNGPIPPIWLGADPNGGRDRSE